MQTDRPLGEMSDEELRVETQEPRGFVTFKELVEWSCRRDRAAAELSRRERRSAARETGAQDDA